MKFKLFTLTFLLLAGTAWAQQSVLDTHPKHLFETGNSLFAEKNYPNYPGLTIRAVPCMRLCGKGPNIRWDGQIYHGANEALIRRLVEGR